MAGRFDPVLAREAGRLLGGIHAKSWGDPRLRLEFDTLPNFDQLRIDPYLRVTAARHPDLRDAILSEAGRLAKAQECLIHGDFSPKNILHTPGRVVALDCEVACYGDAAFDLAFFLNHLFLKHLYHAPAATDWGDTVASVRQGYRRGNPQHADAVETRVARLLPMLMLARVDGKSPVEYLDPEKQNRVRKFAGKVLFESLPLDGLVIRWQDWVAQVSL